MKTLVAVMIAMLVLIPTIYSIPDSGIKLENNVDRPGMNYKSYYPSSADPQVCANDCANDPNCEAFTYVKPGFRGPNSQPECWLKNGVPNTVSQEYCISGKKASVMSESPSVDWNNIPGLVLHLIHNVNQQQAYLYWVKPNLSLKTNIQYFHGGDLCGSSGEGYCWWMIEDNPSADAADWNSKLPSGLVLGLKHSINQQFETTLFGHLNTISSGPVGGIEREIGGDICADAGQGYFWYETHNSNFKNWDEAEKNLPKGTVLGLKHSTHQPDKTVIWRDQEYDPVKSYNDGAASPPTFIAKNGGDLGGSSGEGYYWFEKTTGPDFFQIANPRTTIYMSH